MLSDGETFSRNGREFQVELPYDEDHGAPWENEDGHGPVSEWTTRKKEPGEMVLNSDHGSHRYYDFAEAVKIAKRDGWNAKPFCDSETKGERAHKAAMADYERLRRWCNDQWHYVGVVVTEKCACCGSFTAESESLWGIESDADDYLQEVAFELADTIPCQESAPCR